MQFNISSLDHPLHPPSFHMAISPRSFSACVRGCVWRVSVVFATRGRHAHVFVRSQSPLELSPTVFQLETETSWQGDLLVRKTLIFIYILIYFLVFVSCYPDLDDLRLSIQINCRILGKNRVYSSQAENMAAARDRWCVLLISKLKCLGKLSQLTFYSSWSF